MAQVCLDVPAALTGPLRESAALLLSATAEALQLALREGEPAGEHRERLGQLELLLDRLGWPGRPAAGDVRLAGPAEVLHDVVLGGLIDSGERLAARCSAGRAAGADIEAAAREVIALDRLLRRVERR